MVQFMVMNLDLCVKIIFYKDFFFGQFWDVFVYFFFIRDVYFQVSVFFKRIGCIIGLKYRINKIFLFF